MADMITELQIAAVYSDTDMPELLRKAYLVSVKLGLEEFSSWLGHELNGYGRYDTIPDYRKVRGELKGWSREDGWVPVILQDEDLPLR